MKKFSQTIQIQNNSFQHEQGKITKTQVIKSVLIKYNLLQEPFY